MTDLPTAIRTLRWMVRDTFRQSLASRLFWLILGLSVLCTLLCLSIRVTGAEEWPAHPDEIPAYYPKSQATPEVQAEGIRVVGGEVSLGFGVFKFAVGKSKTRQVVTVAATRTVSLKAGASNVNLSLSKAAKTLLKQRRSVKVKVTLTPVSGGSAVTKTITLKRA